MSAPVYCGRADPDVSITALQLRVAALELQVLATPPPGREWRKAGFKLAKGFVKSVATMRLDEDVLRGGVYWASSASIACAGRAPASWQR